MNEFIAGYCERSGLTPEEFAALYDVHPCEDGWQASEKGKGPLLEELPEREQKPEKLSAVIERLKERLEKSGDCDVAISEIE